MTEGTGGKAAITTRTMEIAIAVFFLHCSANVIYASARLGAMLGEDSQQAGHVPFNYRIVQGPGG